MSFRTAQSSIYGDITSLRAIKLRGIAVVSVMVSSDLVLGWNARYHNGFSEIRYAPFPIDLSGPAAKLVGLQPIAAQICDLDAREISCNVLVTGGYRIPASLSDVLIYCARGVRTTYDDQRSTRMIV